MNGDLHSERDKEKALNTEAFSDSSAAELPADEAASADETACPAIVELPCVHCGLPTRVRADADPQRIFCCNGCHGAYDLINGWGLSDFYALRDQMTSAAAQGVPGQRSRYDVFDQPEFLGDSAPKPQSGGLLSTDLALHGLHCGACAWLIENAAARIDGWQLARVKMSDHTIRIVFDPQRVPLSEIARTMDRLGYQVAPLTKQLDDHFARENRRLLIQIAIAGFCAANAMWIAIGLYAGEASGVDADHRTFLRTIGTGLGLLAVAVPGRTFFRGALASLRTRTPHMDLPVALGLSVGSIAGLINAITGRGDVYFDSLAVLVFFLLIGRWIQFRQQHRAARSVDLLLRITPRHASRILDDGETQAVLADNLQAGDRIRVAAGESFPADGEIIAGETTIDRSLLTGESQPIRAAVGETVLAGTVNVTRSIDVCVEASGDASRIGRVMQAVEAAAARKTPIVQLADRIGGIFVIVVTTLALVAFALSARDNWQQGAANATALLIVACPCALALATPLAIAVSLGRAARRKILIRDGSSLQQLAGTGTIWFDKTGTLTEGRSRVVEVIGDRDGLASAAAIERDVCHPIADAILAAADLPDDLEGVAATDKDNSPAGTDSTDEATARTQIAIGGVLGEHRGAAIAAGSLKFIQSQGIEIPAKLSQAAERLTAQGTTAIVVARDAIAITVLGIDDPLRAGADVAIAELKRAGWRVGILSGDHPGVVRSVADRVGVPQSLAIGGLSPENKLDIVSHHSPADPGSAELHLPEPAPGLQVMIGDGANDAAALAAADVGIAVRGGAEVSLQAAPIFIASGRLGSVVELVRGARRTARLIHITFAVSLGYNVIAVGLAMAGRISPLVAAVLMPLSSVSVLSLTLASRSFRERDELERTK
ncbi:Copper-exporting P-type ATPase A [Rosistilla oblonga]|nr:Copper-exporting P-type ATPase A [Rosistilla oblonga]